MFGIFIRNKREKNDSDILFGKTILCSGQSNIDTIILPHAFNASAEIAACATDFPVS